MKHRYRLLALAIATGCVPSRSVVTPTPPTPIVPTPPTPPSPAPPTPPTPAPPTPIAELQYRGVNLNGADFGDCCPGIEGRNYGWPTNTEVDYFRGKGMDSFRIGFRWERLQPSLNGELDEVYGGKLAALVTYATAKGATVFLNPQNFARYNGAIIGSSAVPSVAFADFWRRLALRYKTNARVVFGLVNEPHDMPTEQWLAAANPAIAAIRAVEAQNLISIPGNGWTGAMHWSSKWYGTPNSVVMLNVVDPANRHIFEVHNYFGADGSGGAPECASVTIGTERMKNVVVWAKANRKRIWLGEIGTPNTPTCAAAVKDLLEYVRANADVIAGWNWWSAGPRWRDEYPLSIQPRSDGSPRPQLAWLLPFLQPQSLPCPAL